MVTIDLIYYNTAWWIISHYYYYQVMKTFLQYDIVIEAVNECLMTSYMIVYGHEQWRL